MYSIKPVINIEKFTVKASTGAYVFINVNCIVSLEHHREGFTAVYLTDGRKIVVEYSLDHFYKYMKR